MISSSMKTTLDVKRQTRTFYARANLLIRNFRHYTDKVKCYLFQSCCRSTGMYCSQLWFNSTNDVQFSLILLREWNAAQMLLYLLVYLDLFTCIPLFVSGRIHFCIYPSHFSHCSNYLTLFLICLCM